MGTEHALSAWESVRFRLLRGLTCGSGCPRVSARDRSLPGLMAANGTTIFGVTYALRAYSRALLAVQSSRWLHVRGLLLVAIIGC
jgi:hypothetical protein